MALSDCEKCWSTPCDCGYQGYLTLYLPADYTTPDENGWSRRPLLSRSQIMLLEGHLKIEMGAWLEKHIPAHSLRLRGTRE